jgi:hypothetical protein
MRVVALCTVVLACCGWGAQAQSCYVSAPLTCALVPDTALHGSVCNSLTASVTGATYGLPLARDANGTLAKCSTDTAYVATVPAGRENAVVTITTVVDYSSMTPTPSANAVVDADTAIEILVGTSGIPVTIGRFSPGGNTIATPAMAPSTPVTLPVNSGPRVAGEWPFNGHAFCNASYSHQVWEVSAIAAAHGVYGVRIRDGTGALRVHSVVLGTCAVSYPSLPSAHSLFSHTVAYVAVDTTVATSVVLSTTSPSRTSCHDLCRSMAACRVFYHQATSQQCILLSNFNALRTSTEPAYVGTKQVATPQVFANISVPTVSLVQAAKIIRPEQFPVGQFSALVIPRLSGDTDHRTLLYFDTLTNYAIGAAQVNFEDYTLAVLTSDLDIVSCGRVSTPFVEGGGTTASCGTVRYCQTQGTRDPSSPKSLFVAMPPVMPSNVTCHGGATAEVRSLAIVQYKGTLQLGSRYWFAHENADRSSHSDMQTQLAEHHATSISGLDALNSGNSRALFRYLAGASATPSATAPSWRWVDEDGLQRSASVLCEVSSPFGYTVVHNEPGTSSANSNCNTYNTIDTIAAACEARADCVGFTMQSDGTTDHPRCLKTAATRAGAADESYTLYLKTAAEAAPLTCQFPVMNSQQVRLEVSSALLGSSAVVRVDGAVVGSCDTSTLTFPSDANACDDYATCFFDVIDSTASVVSITFSTPVAPYRSRCLRAAATVLATFNPTTRFAPSAGCFTTLSLVSAAGCTTRARPLSTCVTLAQSGITLQQSGGSVTYCEVDQAAVAQALFTMPSPSSSPRAIITVVDLSGLPAVGSSQIATVEVYAIAPNGQEVRLGVLFTPKDLNQIHYSPAGAAGRLAESLCTATTLRLTSPAGGFQVFPIPSYLASIGISRIAIRGAGARVLAVATQATSCQAFPLPVAASDLGSKYVLPGATFTGAALSTSSVENWGACAAACGADSSCRAWSVVAAPDPSVGNAAVTCTLRGAIRNIVANDLGTAGVKATSRAVNAFAAPPSRTSIAEFIRDDRLNNAVLFRIATTTGSTNVRVGISQATLVQVAVAETILGNTSALLLASPFGAQHCGPAHFRFDAATTPTVCESLRTCPAMVTSEASTGVMNIVPTNLVGSVCNSVVWGVVATDGNVSGSVSYRRGAFFSDPATTLADIGGLSSSDVRSKDAQSVQLDDDFVVLSTYVVESDGDAMTIPTLSASRPNAVCEVHSVLSYDIIRGRSGSSASQVKCQTVTSVQAAVDACHADDTCAGFTVTANDRLQCFHTTVAESTLTASATLDLYVKRRSLSCKVRLASAGNIKITMSQTGLARGESEAKVTQDGRPLRSCGGNQPFVSGFSTAAQSCNVYRTCVDDMIVATGGEIAVTLPSQLARGECPHAAIIHFEYTPALAESSGHIAAARALPNVRTVRVRGTSTGVGVTVRGHSISRVAVLVQQDRYECLGGCTINYALNVSLSGQVLARCGGILGFSDFRGLSSSCGTYLFCGNTLPSVSGLTVAPAAKSGTEISVNIVDPRLYLATGCSAVSDLRLVVFADGTLYGANSGLSETRVLYALTVDRSEIGTDAAGLAQLGDARRFELLKTQYPQFDAVYYVEWLFQVKQNNDKLPSYALLPFDVPSVAESSKLMAPNTVAMCLIDQLTDRSIYPRCRLTISGTSVKVLVAQTSFAAYNQLVTIAMGARLFTCGGDGLFYGLQGANDRCDTYYTCYDGIAYSNEILITFSGQVDGSTCPNRAVAAVQVSDRSAPVAVTCNDNAAPFNCVPLGQCFALSRVCDGTVDCTDGTDEGSCTNWNYVIGNTQPSCDSNPPTIVTSSTTECQKFAVAKKAKALTLGAGVCRVYTCLNFDFPELESTVNSSQPISDLYIQASDPTAFKQCTDALHCSNNGVVLSPTPPCQCSCDVQYIGDRCESVRDISLLEALFVVFPPNAVLNTSALAAIITAATDHAVDPLTTISVQDIRYSPTSTAVQLNVINSYSGQQSEDVHTLLSRPVSSAVLAELAPYGAIRITATSVVGNDVSVACNLANISAIAESNVCERTININETQSVTITVPAITLASDSQWVRLELVAYDFTVTELVCNSTDFVRTVNPLLDGPCAVSSTCTKILDRAGTVTLRVVVSPDINPNTQVCTAGRAFESTIKVSGFISLPDTRIDTTSSSATSYNGSLFLLSILLFILGALALIHLIVWLVWMRRRFESVKYLGPIAGTLSFFLLLGGAISYGLYLDSAESTYSHLLLVEEYRDDICEDSEFAFIPSRAGYVEVTEDCRQLSVIGQAQGVSYLAARIPNGTLDVVELKYGGTVETCGGAAWRRYPFRRCVAQSDLFSLKPVVDQLYMQLISLPENIVLERIHAIEAFNPPTVLSAEVTVSAIPAENVFTATTANTGKLTYVQNKQLTSLQFPTDSGRASETTHLLVPATVDLSEEVAANESHYTRVRFVATFDIGRTLFSSPYTVLVDSLPTLAEGNRPTDFENVGTYFNGYYDGTSLTTYSGAAAYRGAQKYFGVAGTFLDIATHDVDEQDFTITFWLRADSQSRGVVWAATDAWTAASGEIPTITRLVSLIENGQKTTAWFNTDTDVYAGIYLDGQARSFAFVHTVDGVLEEVSWDTAFLGVDRIFDGRWHFIAVQFLQGNSNLEAQLWVDGETSHTEEGWRHCLKLDIKPIRTRNPGDSIFIYNPREETFYAGGLFVIGHANVALYDFAIHSRALQTEDMVRYGAAGMDNYFTVARAESITIGVLLSLLAVCLVLAMIFEIWRYFFGVDTSVYLDQNQKRVRNDQTAAQTDGGLAESGGGSSRGELLVQFINPVIGVSQSMALYLAAWRWPDVFVESLGKVYSALSLDLFNLIPDMPVLLAPAIQFGLAILSLFAMVIFAVRDEEVYAQVLMAYRNRTRSADRALTRRLELDRPKPEYRWVVYDDKSDKRDLTPEQAEFLQRGLHELLTSSHRKAKNMRLHSKALLEFPGIGWGILLYERRDGDIGIFFRLTHDQRLNEADLVSADVETKQADYITMTQFTFECVADNVQCPLHERRLLKSEMEGLSCVHNESTYYRSVACNADAQMYQCPESDCMYAICADCWKHGAGAADSALTGALSTLAEMKRKGVWKATSTIIIVVALVMYLPVTKNAMLILTCHPSFQCEFGACWSDPDMKYLIAVLLCIITVIFIGIGLIVLQTVLLYRRHRSLLEELPLMQVVRKYNIPCRANYKVQRQDYDAFLAVDESMLKALYSVFDFEQLFFGPVYLLYKAAIIIAVVGSQPRSLTQLTVVSIIEAAFGILLTVRSPYKNVFIEAVSRVSSLHQIVMLALTCLHRVDVADGGDGYGPQMVLAVLVYAGFVVLIGIGIIISPWLRRVCLRDSVEKQLEKELAEEDERIADEKEERRRVQAQKEAQFAAGGYKEAKEL